MPTVSTCRICAKPARAGKLGLCGAHEMQWRRAGKPDVGAFVSAVRSGEPLGRVRRPCVVCRTVFAPYGSQNTCSDGCRRKLRARRDAERWRANRNDMRGRSLERNRRRRKEKPEWARAADARRWRRVKEDPEKYARVRQKARDHYARHAAEIQGRRREHFLSLPPEEQFRLRDRGRRYALAYLDRVRRDPARSRGRRTYGAEYRRAKKLRQLELEAVRFLGLLEGRPPRPRPPCEVCGKPVVNRRSTAKTCSRECQKQRHTALFVAPRYKPERTCAECGRPFTAKTAAKACSKACAKARKARLSRRQPLMRRYPHDQSDNPNGQS